MSTSRTLLRAIAPELAGVDDATVDVFLGLAAERMDATAWGDLFQQGAVYLAAHLCVLAQRAAATGVSGGAGPVSAIKTGDVSVSFGAIGGVIATASMQAMSTTPHGLQYLALRRQVPMTGFVV